MYKLILLLCLFGSCLAAKSGNIVRPCHLAHTECIRENLAANSRCNPKVAGSIPASYMLPEFRFETPHFNASYIDRNLVIQNHHKCYVSQFYYNLKTSVAVLSVDCPGLIFSSNRTLIQHASYQEDHIYSFTSSWEYPMIRLTTNIKHDAHMDLCNSFVFTDVAVMPRYQLKPNDKPTKDFLSYDLSELNIYERETFFYRGPQLFQKYINSVLCDFGC